MHSLILPQMKWSLLRDLSAVLATEYGQGRGLPGGGIAHLHGPEPHLGDVQKL